MYAYIQNVRQDQVKHLQGRNMNGKWEGFIFSYPKLTLSFWYLKQYEFVKKKDIEDHLSI